MSTIVAAGVHWIHFIKVGFIFRDGCTPNPYSFYSYASHQPNKPGTPLKEEFMVVTFEVFPLAIEPLEVPQVKLTRERSN
jgi:hypothetical protein